MPEHLTSLLIASFLLPAQIPTSVELPPEVSQRLNLYVQPAMVQVVSGCAGQYSFGNLDYSFAVGEVGTGYFISPDGYILTNYRSALLAEESSCKDYLVKYLEERSNSNGGLYNGSKDSAAELRSRIRLVGNVSRINQVIFSTGDTFPFEIKKAGKAISGDPEDVAVIKIPISNAPTLKISITGLMSLQEPVVAIAYPLKDNAESFFKSVFQDSKALNQPLDRPTFITGLLSNSKQATKGKDSILQFSVATPFGSSGAPVLNADSKVIGMITASSKDSIDKSDPALVIPSNTLDKYASPFQKSNRQNLTDTRYTEGLALFEKKDYEGAKAKFQEVKSLFPYHPTVDQLIEASTQNIAQAKANKSKFFLLVGGGLVVVILPIGYFLFRRLRRPKPKSTAKSSRRSTASVPIAGSPSRLATSSPNSLTPRAGDLTMQGNPQTLARNQGTGDRNSQPSTNRSPEIPSRPYEAPAYPDPLIQRQDPLPSRFEPTPPAAEPMAPQPEAPARAEGLPPIEPRVRQPELSPVVPPTPARPDPIPHPAEPVAKQPEPSPLESPFSLESAEQEELNPSATYIGDIADGKGTIIGTEPFVEAKNHTGQVKRFYLFEDRHQLGRDLEWADIYLGGKGWEVLSRHHATLEREGNDYRIYDGDRQHPSSNGIFIGNIRISCKEGHLLKDGDQLQTGRNLRNPVIFTYHNPSGHE